ncbi:hypothetical protein ACAF76_018515 [Brevibacillus sp. TJ4]|uniref:hypothetical protein n=1 Tax=Brevibacillus sp. TJ4 TaxID=3234853 RepID=UPI003BA34457
MAGIFAFLILLMNAFPVVVLAQPYVPNLGGETYQAPQMQAPDLQAPQWEMPNLEAPQWEVPNLEPPPGSPPVLESPNSTTPNLQPPAGNVPGLQTPNGTAPALGPPNSTVPNLENPGGTVPDLQAQGGAQPSQTPGIEAPSIQPPNSTPPALDGGSLESVPFGETVGYKAMELTFKDIFGGTLGYSAGLLESGTVTAGQGAGGYAHFLFQVGLKGLDISVQGSKWADLTGGALDIYGAKGAYDSYKFVSQLNPSSVLGGVNTQRSVTNGLQGAAGAANTVRVPGIVAGLNAGVAAIALPFDVYNTFTQFGQAYNPNLSQSQQNEKFVDGVGSLGSSLMDAGIIAAVIPGGQTVAAALVITGGVLWGGSRLVKWINKGTGGALEKGINWVREGIGNAVGWVKSIFS